MQKKQIQAALPVNLETFTLPSLIVACNPQKSPEPVADEVKLIAVSVDLHNFFSYFATKVKNQTFLQIMPHLPSWF